MTQLPLSILPSGGEALYYSALFRAEESEAALSRLESEIQWRQEPVIMFGRAILQPRLTALYGDPTKSYRYSGLTMQPLPWTELLLDLKHRVERTAGTTFTTVLLNQYRDEQDSMGWHRDNEKELGENPQIGSLSFGEVRTFKLRRYLEPHVKVSIDLEPGSFLLMRGECQEIWEHCLPKTKRPKGLRINLTFRSIKAV